MAAPKIASQSRPGTAAAAPRSVPIADMTPTQRLQLFYGPARRGNEAVNVFGQHPDGTPGHAGQLSRRLLMGTFRNSRQLARGATQYRPEDAPLMGCRRLIAFVRDYCRRTTLLRYSMIGRNAAVVWEDIRAMEAMGMDLGPLRLGRAVHDLAAVEYMTLWTICQENRGGSVRAHVRWQLKEGFAQYLEAHSNPADLFAVQRLLGPSHGPRASRSLAAAFDNVCASQGHQVATALAFFAVAPDAGVTWRLIRSVAAAYHSRLQGNDPVFQTLPPALSTRFVAEFQRLFRRDNPQSSQARRAARF